MTRIVLDQPSATYNPASFVAALVVGLNLTRGQVLSMGAAESAGQTETLISLRGLNRGGAAVFNQLEGAIANDAPWVVALKIVSAESVSTEGADIPPVVYIVTYTHNGLRYAVPQETFMWIVGVVALVFLLTLSECMFLRRSRNEYEKMKTVMNYK